MTQTNHIKYENMTDEELQIAIATRQGWTYKCGLWIAPDQPNDDLLYGHLLPPNYVHDMNAALSLPVGWFMLENHHTHGWQAHIGFIDECASIAQSAARAIVCSWLKDDDYKKSVTAKAHANLLSDKD